MADHTGKSRYVKAAFAALFAAALVALGCEAPSPVEDSAGKTPPMGEAAAEAAPDQAERQEVQGNRVFEYKVMVDGVGDVVDVLREARGSGMLGEEGELRINLPALLDSLRAEGVLEEVSPSEDPAVSMLLKDPDGVPRGLIRITDVGGEPRLQFFRSVGTTGGDR